MFDWYRQQFRTIVKEVTIILGAQPSAPSMYNRTMPIAGADPRLNYSQPQYVYNAPVLLSRAPGFVRTQANVGGKVVSDTTQYDAPKRC